MNNILKYFTNHPPVPRHPMQILSLDQARTPSSVGRSRPRRPRHRHRRHRHSQIRPPAHQCRPLRTED